MRNLAWWVTVLIGYIWGVYIMIMSYNLDGWQFFAATLPVSFLVGAFGPTLFDKMLDKEG